jgi:hypothetical protein
MARRSLVVVLMMLLGCERELSFGNLLPNGDSSPTPGMEAGTAPRLDATTPDSSFDVEAGRRDAQPAESGAGSYCEQRGPMFRVTDTSTGSCGANASGFHYGLCSCNIMQSNELLRVDGWDSRTGAYTADGRGTGTVALNGAMYAPAEIAGSLLIAGALGASPTGDLEIGGSLVSLGPVSSAGHRVSVGGDARVVEALRAEELAIGGTLTMPEGALVQVNRGVAPPIVRGPITLDAPCRCDQQLDLLSAIDSASRSNDNAIIGLDAATGLHTSGGAVRRELPCGKYFVEDVDAASALTLRITGRVALFVRRSIVSQNVPFTIELAAGAELDLILGEGISAMGQVTIGDPAKPGRTRVYVAGQGTSGTLYFLGALSLAASVYAPSSELARAGTEPATVYGALLVERATSLPPLTVHYDRTLTDDRCVP